jgi:hypothetical protein
MRRFDAPSTRRQVEDKRERQKQECQSERRRLDYLRQTLSEDPNEDHFVKNVQSSRERWENPGEYRSGITAGVRAWGKRPQPTEPSVQKPVKGILYDLENDVNVDVIQNEHDKFIELAKISNSERR